MDDQLHPKTCWFMKQLKHLVDLLHSKTFWTINHTLKYGWSQDISSMTPSNVADEKLLAIVSWVIVSFQILWRISFALKLVGSSNRHWSNVIDHINPKTYQGINDTLKWSWLWATPKKYWIINHTLKSRRKNSAINNTLKYCLSRVTP